jgi:hypothetical protein
VDNEFEKVYKEAVLILLKYYSIIFLELMGNSVTQTPVRMTFESRASVH